MGFIKSLFTDLLNGFPIDELPLLFVQIFSALVLSLVVIKMNPLIQAQRNKTLLFIAVFTLMIALSKESIHLSVILAGLSIMIAVLVKDKLESLADKITFAVLIMLSFCCGSGYVIPAFIIFALIIFPLLWINKKQ